MLLYEDKAYYNDVVNIYKNDIDEKTNNTTQVILNKAINALKVFGIKITKRKNKYILDSSLYSLNYDIDDLKSISLIINAIENFPDEKTKDNVSQLVKNLQIRMNNSAKNTLTNLAFSHDFSFFYTDLKEQIESCKELCKTQMLLYVTYLQNGKECHAKGMAKDITFDTKNAYLQMFDTDNNLALEIPVTNILDLKPDTLKCKSMENATTITYEIYGRLAKTYRLKENESLLNKTPEGNLVITNKDEPLDKLFQRLMRYWDCCRILGPKPIKAQMQNLINETLLQYENDK